METLKTYKNREGKRVVISRMSDSYLSNAIRYFKRAHEHLVKEANACAWYSPQGEVAQDWHNADEFYLNKAVEESERLILSLEKEAERRKN